MLALGGDLEPELVAQAARNAQVSALALRGCGQRDGKPVAAAAARRRGRHRGGARRSPAEDGYPLVALGIPKQKQKGHFPIPLYWSSVGRASRTFSPPPPPPPP